MHPIIQMRQHSREARARRAAAERVSTPETSRAARLARHHELVTDDDGTQHISPKVHCDRHLDGWLPMARTVYRAVIR